MATPFDSDAFLKTLTTLPGVYRMLDERDQVLYVGKARNLKQRVASYFREKQTSAKTLSLVAHIHAIDVTITHTEAEALILESTLIKQLQPRYNILLRDDKSYPYLYVSTDDFPCLSLHRGARRASGRYFGPYPHANSVRDTLNLLQKVFRLRSCEDSFFRTRSRPCLQYQIKRCTAPCVGFVSHADYQRQISDALLFLEGRSGEIVDALAHRMEAAATVLDFEAAAICRDQIADLRRIQQHQHVEGACGDLDSIACAVQGGAACVQVFMFRQGRLLGNRAFFPRLPETADAGAVLSAFLTQHYLDQEIPPELLVSHPLTETALFTQAFQERAGRRIAITAHPRGERARWLDWARRNAEHALIAHLSGQIGIRQRLNALQQSLELDFELTRLECFDISHTGGEATVAACVVFGMEGAMRTDYRRYNISNITAGDDYAALRQALHRRYTRLKEEEGHLPDILLIDGGKGQLAQAREVLEELQVVGVITVGVAKGVERRPGLETLHLSGRNDPITLPADSVALHLVQQIRDEAHRFAITGHRQCRAKARTASALEHIPGIGPKRRQALLKQFGGVKQLAQAGVEDIARVAGINTDLAQRIYDRFHSGS